MRVIQLKDQGVQALVDFLEQRRQGSADVTAIVQDVLEQVRNNGDAAVLAYTQKFDGFQVADAAQLKVTPEEVEQLQRLTEKLHENMKREEENNG